jgi:cell division protein FtsQ
MAKESKKSGVPWRTWLSAAGLVLLFAATGMAALRVRRYVLEDDQFVLSRDRKGSLVFEGMRYTSRYRVMRVFNSDFGHSIFSIPLDERRRRLLGVDWVEDATVSRVWPDRLVVRLRERTPVAYVSLRSGVVLIDAHGTLLDPPPASHFAFPVLSGVGEDEKEDELRERVRTFLRFEQEMGYLAKDVSEVDVSDMDNIRVVAQVDKKAVQLTMGDSNFASRYQNFISHYAEIVKHSPEVKSFDLRMDDRITAK